MAPGVARTKATATPDAIYRSHWNTSVHYGASGPGSLDRRPAKVYHVRHSRRAGGTADRWYDLSGQVHRVYLLQNTTTETVQQSQRCHPARVRLPSMHHRVRGGRTIRKSVCMPTDSDCTNARGVCMGMIGGCRPTPHKAAHRHDAPSFGFMRQWTHARSARQTIQNIS